MNQNIFVCGATGTVGSLLISQLSTQPVTVFAASRFKTKNPRGIFSVYKNVQEVELDYSDFSKLNHSLSNVDKVFALFPEGPDMVLYAKNLVLAARNNGIKHLVFMSGAGVELSPGSQLSTWLASVEDIIINSGIPYTIIRPVFFMQNFYNFHSVQPDGNIYAPLGNNKIGFIDAGDIAKFAAKMLVHPDENYLNKIFTITSLQAYTLSEAAQIIGKFKGQAVSYIDVPEAAARQGMLAAGLPEFMIEVILEVYAAARAGKYNRITNDFEAVMGYAPKNLQDFISASSS